MHTRQDLPERRVDLRPDATESHQAALLIDFDNVTMGIRSNLGLELRNLLNSDVIRGKVAVQRAYADWRRYPQYIVPLSEASIDLIFAPAYGSTKKNATDIRLAIDALELVFIRPEIRTFILMSGDSDFSSLVLKLKEYGKYIIGVGIQESSSDLLVQNCDEYYSYSALSGLTKSGDQPLERHDPWVLAEKAIGKMVERGDTMRSDRLKQVMLEIDPSFNEKEQGFNKFNRFVVEAASRGLLSIQKMDNGQYGVAPGKASSKPAKADPGKAAKVDAKGEAKGEKQEKPPAATSSRERPRRKRERKSRPEAEVPEGEPGITRRARPKLTMKSALALLDEVLGILLEGGEGTVRDSDVKRRLLELDPGFDEGELGFSKFSKFLHAAEEEGAVELTRGPNGNYHVARSKRKGKRGKRVAMDDAAVGSSDAETTMKRLARFFFGGTKPEEDQDIAAEPQTQAAQVVDAQPPAESARDAKGPAEQRGGRGARAQREPGGRRAASDRPKAEAGQREAQKSERQARGERDARRGPDQARGGRRRSGGERSGQRRGERSGRKEERTIREAIEPSISEAPPAEPERVAVSESKPSAAPAVESVVQERVPVPSSDPKTQPPAAEEVGPDAGPAVTAAPLPGAPRGTIRGRWGSRGRYRPAGSRPPILEGQRSERSSPAGASSSTESDETAARPAEYGKADRKAALSDELQGLVGHLTGYAGVGRKTAETLVEAFGSDLLRILDQQPERVREVLPDHRAERVLEARREERDAGAK